MLRDVLDTAFVGELTEGMHPAILKAWDFKQHESDANKDYIRCTFRVFNGNAEQLYTRNLFERDLTIALSQIRRQMGNSTQTIQPRPFLNALTCNEELLAIWIEYKVVPTHSNGLRRVQNLSFQEPLNPTEATHTIVGEETPLD